MVRDVSTTGQGRGWLEMLAQHDRGEEWLEMLAQHDRGEDGQDNTTGDKSFLDYSKVFTVAGYGFF